MRKLKELIITLRMEKMLSKRRILEIYLNVIEWGNGVFGAEAAARKYFGTSAANITRDEAARLAAVIPSPLRHQPNQTSQYVERRSSIILERMNARGY
jgi:monofunctional biosynthetic peptidoglycan transglycosylase